jgi:hypothetical protein
MEKFDFLIQLATTLIVWISRNKKKIPCTWKIEYYGSSFVFSRRSLVKKIFKKDF